LANSAVLIYLQESKNSLACYLNSFLLIYIIPYSTSTRGQRSFRSSASSCHLLLPV